MPSAPRTESSTPVADLYHGLTREQQLGDRGLAMQSLKHAEGMLVEMTGTLSPGDEVRVEYALDWIKKAAEWTQYSLSKDLPAKVAA